MTLSNPRSIARFSDHTLLVRSFRKGRVFLAGDAAHLHPPFGGQGLNLGILDATNLGWKLAGVVSGRLYEPILDTYDTERRPLARRAIRNSLADVALLAPGDRMTPAFELYSEIKSIPEIRHHLLDLISLRRMRYDMGASGDDTHPLLGGPDAMTLIEPDCYPSGLAIAHRYGFGILLDLRGRHDLRSECAWWSDLVRVVVAKPSSTADVDAVLIRPDGYVAWVAPRDKSAQPGPLRDSLCRWFGRPHAYTTAGRPSSKRHSVRARG